VAVEQLLVILLVVVVHILVMVVVMAVLVDLLQAHLFQVGEAVLEVIQEQVALVAAVVTVQMELEAVEAVEPAVVSGQQVPEAALVFWDKELAVLVG
jgi:hypothetical protein